MQRPGTEAIRTQIQTSKLKLEITNITNGQNTKRTYGQPREQQAIYEVLVYRILKHQNCNQRTPEMERKIFAYL